MAKVIIPVEVINKALNFLAAMPYNQVVDLINEIQQNSVIQKEEEQFRVVNDEEEVES